MNVCGPTHEGGDNEKSGSFHLKRPPWSRWDNNNPAPSIINGGDVVCWMPVCPPVSAINVIRAPISSARQGML